MKKRNLIIPLVILTMIFSMSMYTNVSNASIIIPDDFVNKAVSGRPIFDGSDPAPLIERDSQNNQGALIIADPANNVTNVTIWYKLDGGDNTTLPLLLFLEDDTKDLTWSNPTPMVYDELKTNETTTNYAFYNYTFDINTSHIAFRAWYKQYEDDIGIPNVITTGVRVKSEFLSSSYSQFNIVDMNVSLYDYNITDYGLIYRKVVSTHDEEFQASTFSLAEEGIYTNVSANFNHTYKAGTRIEVRAYVIHYDNITNENRILFENEAHIIKLTDGTPEIELISKRYTNELQVSLKWNATTYKDTNVTAVNIDWGDGNDEDVVNVSIHTIYHEYESEGEYKITVTVEAGLTFGSETTKVLIDQTLPTCGIDYIDPDDNPNDGNITINGQKLVTVTFNASDEESGIDKIVLETDEGNVYELLDKKQYTVEFLNYGYHTVTIKAYDKAGNVFTQSVSFTLVSTENPKDIAVPFSSVAIIVGLVSLIFLKRNRK